MLKIRYKKVRWLAGHFVFHMSLELETSLCGG